MSLCRFCEGYRLSHLRGVVSSRGDLRELDSQIHFLAVADLGSMESVVRHFQSYNVCNLSGWLEWFFWKKPISLQSLDSPNKKPIVACGCGSYRRSWKQPYRVKDQGAAFWEVMMMCFPLRTGALIESPRIPQSHRMADSLRNACLANGSWLVSWWYFFSGTRLDVDFRGVYLDDFMCGFPLDQKWLRRMLTCCRSIKVLSTN